MCAGGSQVWNGTVGVLTASPSRIAARTKPPATGLPPRGVLAARVTMSNVCGWAAIYRPMKPTSSASEPRKV